MFKNSSDNTIDSFRHPIKSNIYLQNLTLVCFLVQNLEILSCSLNIYFLGLLTMKILIYSKNQIVLGNLLICYPKFHYKVFLIRDHVFYAVAQNRLYLIKLFTITFQINLIYNFVVYIYFFFSIFFIQYKISKCLVCNTSYEISVKLNVLLNFSKKYVFRISKTLIIP